MVKGRDNKKKVNQQVHYDKKQLIRDIRNSEDITMVLRYTTHQDADIRLEAVKQLCPCRCQADIPQFWIRVFNLVEDQDARIRDRILHIICDGSPSRIQQKMVQAMQIFNRDPDSNIRRKAHKVMVHYQNTGKWNIL